MANSINDKIMYMIIATCILYLLITIVSYWRIFKENNEKGWKVLVPILNHITICKIAGIKKLSVILMYLPIINIFYRLYLFPKFARSIGKKGSFGIGLALLPAIFAPFAYKTNRISLKLATFLLVILTFGFIYIPLLSGMKFGLDLKGGFEVLYQVKRSDGKKLTTNDMNSTYDVLKRNIDGLGVSEPEIIMEGTDRIRVKLAGVKDIEGARKTLSNVANISFRDVDDRLLMDSSVISGAKLGYDESSNPCISLQVKDKDKFLEATTEISQMESGKNLMVIWYNFENGVNSYEKDGETCGDEGSDCLSAATVSQGFASDVIITGNFTKEDAEQLATSINAGSISTKLSEISSQNVNASYGAGVLSKTFTAGIIGMILVILFMTVLYKFSGFISGMNLFLYMLLVMGIFWLIGGVLTLPGIAALVLGIGMAVDSCVITNERIKEALAEGRNIKTAFSEGNKGSWSSIFDANATTFIVAIILFIFGESSVKGFATMLIITIFATMFIMVLINRLILKLFVNSGYFNDNPNKFVRYLNRKKEPKKHRIVNSMSLIRKCITITSIFLIVGVALVASKGLNLGIDFRSGTDITVSANNITVEKVRSDIESLGYEIISIERQEKGEIYVKLNNELKEDGINEVNSYFEAKYNAKTEINVVTNIVKQELIKNAIMSLIIAAIAIIIYISIRFKFSFALSSIIALIHDVLFVLIAFSLLRIEVNVIFIAAILTIVGYSINNTIVIFDRIRENYNNYQNKITKQVLKDIVNRSISETFTRAINTSVTTLIPVITLIVLGSKGILPFNIAIIFGIVAGGYSSILLAGQIWYIIESKKYKDNKENNVKEAKIDKIEDNKSINKAKNTNRKKKKKK